MGGLLLQRQKAHISPLKPNNTPDGAAHTEMQ